MITIVMITVAMAEDDKYDNNYDYGGRGNFDLQYYIFKTSFRKFIINTSNIKS